MGERFTGYHPENAQTQQPLDSAIARFCVGKNNPNTKAAYMRDLRAFSNFAREAGVGEPKELTRELIDGYLRDCERSGLSWATIKRRTASLSVFLNRAGMGEFAKTTRVIGKGHIDRKAEMQPLHPLSTEEVKKLQEVSRNNLRDSAIIAIALGTGATPEQIRALNASDVLEQESQTVAVRFSGNKSERQVTLDIHASEIVRRHKGERKGEESLFAQRTIPIRQGEDRLGRGSIWSDVKQYGERIGRPDLNPRILRQTFIAHTQTNNPKELAELLGISKESSVRLLERRYITQQLPQSGVLFEAATN